MHLYTPDSRLLAEARGAVEEAAASVHEEEEEARDSEEEEARNYSEDEEVGSAEDCASDAREHAVRRCRLTSG